MCHYTCSGLFLQAVRLEIVCKKMQLYSTVYCVNMTNIQKTAPCLWSKWKNMDAVSLLPVRKQCQHSAQRDEEIRQIEVDLAQETQGHPHIDIVHHIALMEVIKPV